MSMRASARLRLFVDLVFFFGFLLLMQPDLTGISLHEWFSVALLVVMAFHVLFQWDWVMAVTRRFFHKLIHRSRLNYVLDTLLLMAMSTAFVSGFAISRDVLPFFGIPARRDLFWRALHTLSADITLVIVGVHLALHWRWVIHTLKRTLALPLHYGTWSRVEKSRS
ncbi:MAG: DUF4405 domain-containing protein [Chloroflexi bacterium]|nr:MAG: DUF4405 domain-containing protein [Chloroflexota bacterium]